MWPAGLLPPVRSPPKVGVVEWHPAQSGACAAVGWGVVSYEAFVGGRESPIVPAVLAVIPAKAAVSWQPAQLDTAATVVWPLVPRVGMLMLAVPSWKPPVAPPLAE